MTQDSYHICIPSAQKVKEKRKETQIKLPEMKDTRVHLDLH